MKKWKSLVGIIVMAATCQAQQGVSDDAYKAVPPGEVLLRKDQYTEMSTYWRNRTTNNPSDEEAWVNLYTSTRYRLFTERSRSIPAAEQKNLDYLAAQIKMNVPGSFAEHYVNYLNSNKSAAGFSELEKAYAQQPGNPELWPEMFCRSVILQKADERKSFASKMVLANVFSAAEMEYARNLLFSTSSGSILITNGYVDTYPLYILQETKGVRTDLQIVCLEWMGNADYRNKVAALFGMGSKPLPSDPSLALEKLIGASSVQDLFLSLTLPPDELTKYLPQCYVTGLALRYSKTPIANLPNLAATWEMHFSTAYLSSPIALNRNYIVPLAQLANWYRSQGQKEKETDAEALLKKLATLTSAPSRVNPFID